VPIVPRFADTAFAAAVCGSRRLVVRAWPVAFPASLGRRIVASVALGLVLVVIVFLLVALWTVQEATESAYSERVALAEALVWHVDDILSYSLATLEREAASLTIEAGQTIPVEEAERLAALRSEMGGFDSVSVTDAEGQTIWTAPARPDVIVGQQLSNPGVAAALAQGTPQITQLAVPNGERLLASLAVPIRTANGGTIGVLNASLDPAQPALNLLPMRAVGDAIQVHLINSTGGVLAGSA
jgi:hypothetical protein